jgi:single-strand DNA-binding protein
MTSKTQTERSSKSETSKKSATGTSVNRATLVGRLVATPELRETKSGIHVTTIRIATNNREQTEFHDVVLWRQLADLAAGYLTKGRLVYIEGRLQARSWESADGSKRRSFEVVATRLTALTAKVAA